MSDASRAIRVFISSTFRDMQAEREILVKRVFPELRRICAGRQATLTEVDLRWGITEEQKAEGKVLPLCLEEIRHSRPFFVGMLGERYGWIPEGIPPRLLAQEPWLAQHVADRTSVTELEILHGVLNDPAMAGNACFFFRDPAFIETLPAERRHDLEERDWPAEIASYGPDVAARRTAERKAKLEALKDRIRGSGFPVVENYKDPADFGERLYEIFVRLIDRLYPPEDSPDAAARERRAQEGYAQRKTLAHVARPVVTAALDVNVDSALPLYSGVLLTGPSGSGKTSALANWTIARRERSEDFVFAHFAEASGESASVTGMLHRLLVELNRRFDLSEEIPAAPESIRRALGPGLERAAARSSGRIVLAFDGMERWEGTEADQQLAWLSLRLPPQVRVVASTLGGACQEALLARGWHDVPLTPPDVAERELIIDRFLQHYGKNLDPRLRSEIASAPGSSNPLFLRTALEELRQLGDFEGLFSKARELLQAGTPTELFARVIRRWAADFDAGKDLTRRALAYLRASFQGLSEPDWRSLLGDSTGPLLQQEWSPLFLAMEPHLAPRNGLYSFGHEFLRAATAEACTVDETQRREISSKLIAHFRTRADPKGDETFVASGPQALQELSFQLACVDRAELGRLLTRFRWILANVREGLTLRLSEDFETTSATLADDDPNRPTIARLRETMRLALHAVGPDSSQLAGQLLGRLRASEDSGVRRLLADAEAWRPGVRLTPVAPTLLPPGSGLDAILGRAPDEIVESWISADCGTLVSLSRNDTALRVWNLDTGRPKESMPEMASRITCAVVDENCRIGATLTTSDRVVVWDLTIGQELGSAPFERYGRIAMCEDERTLILWSDRAGLPFRWDFRSSEAPSHAAGALADRDASTTESVDLVAGQRCLLIASRSYQGATADLRPRWTLRLIDLTTGARTRLADDADCYALSSDRSWMVVASPASVTRIGLTTTPELDKIATGFRATEMTLSRDDRRLVCLRENGSLAIIKLGCPGKSTVAKRWGRRAAVFAVSRSGATAVSYGGPAIDVWDGDTGRRVSTLEAHRDEVRSLCFLPDARLLSETVREEVAVWDADCGRKVATLRGRPLRTTADGTSIVTALVGRTLAVWRPSESTDLPETRHRAGVTDLQFAPHGDLLASASRDATIRLWDARDFSLGGELAGHSADVVKLAFALDGKLLVSSSWDGSVRIWDPARRQTVTIFGGASDFALSGDGRILILQAGVALEARDVATGKLRGRCDFGQFAISPRIVRVAHDGGVAYTGGVRGELFRASFAGTNSIQELRGHTEPVSDIRLLSDGRRAISTSWDRTIRLWDLNRNVFTRVADALLTHVVVLPGERSAVTASVDGTLSLWDLDRREFLRAAKAHVGSIERLLMIPERTRWRILTAGSDARVGLWSPTRLDSIASFTADVPLAAAAADRTGERIAVGDDLGQVHLLSVDSGASEDSGDSRT